jgi:hypothetical protein
MTSILPKLICRYITISIKIPVEFFIVWNSHGKIKGNTTAKKLKKKSRCLTQHGLKVQYKAINSQEYSTEKR